MFDDFVQRVLSKTRKIIILEIYLLTTKSKFNIETALLFMNVTAWMIMNTIEFHHFF